MQNNGKLTVMNRMNLTANTEVGFDIYQGDEVDYLVGIESKPAENWEFKAKIGSISDFEISIRYIPIEQLKFTFGLRGEFNEVIEKQECSVGFGIETYFM